MYHTRIYFIILITGLPIRCGQTVRKRERRKRERDIEADMTKIFKGSDVPFGYRTLKTLKSNSFLNNTTNLFNSINADCRLCVTVVTDWHNPLPLFLFLLLSPLFLPSGFQRLFLWSNFAVLNVSLGFTLFRWFEMILDWTTSWFFLFRLGYTTILIWRTLKTIFILFYCIY